MTLNYKYTILYTFGSLFLFWMIVKYGTKVLTNCPSKKIIEGLTDFERYSKKIIPYPTDTVINYNDTNSPLYSHSVNLPINDSVSCKNFCGPKSQCAITREQCTSDIDCKGCNPGPTPMDSCVTEDVPPYDAGGKLGQQGLQYSQLTTGYNNHNADFAQIYPDSKDAELKVPYQGIDQWTKSFNEGLKLYNKRRESADKYSQGISNAIPLAMGNEMPSFGPKYPMTVSATGQFYETTPPAANASLQR